MKMSRSHRHAENFTDSLRIFQYSTSSDTLYSISQDSLDQNKAYNLPSNGSTRSSKHSTILAGSCTKDSLSLDSCTSPDTSVRSGLDLNQRIDLFRNDSLKDESIYNAEFKPSCTKVDNKENKDPQCAIKGATVSREIDTLVSSPSRIKKKGTNYNVHRNKFEKNVDRLAMKSSPTFMDCKCKGVSDTNCENEQESVRMKKFERILCSLDNQLNQIKEISQTESTLGRLSEQFVKSPQNFTEKLMTIIEESVINKSGDNTCNVTAFNLSRLTLEFRKMCKFIEDESWPSWAPSLSSTPPSSENVLASPICNQFVDGEYRKEKFNGSMSTDSLPSTPLSATDVLKRRFFQKISKNHYNGSIDSITNVSSVESFERLEAHCKKLFPEEKESSNNLHKSFSMPTLLSMTELVDICDQQMASLNTSDIYKKEKMISSTPNLYNERIEQLPTNKADLQFDTDELQKTILQDIVEKRKRCLDTVRLITEINADTDTREEKRSLDISPVSSAFNDLNFVTKETKFLTTLMSCQNYMTYLERQKPFFMLHEKSEHAPNTPLQNTKENNVENLEARDSLKKFSRIESSTPVSKKVDQESTEKTEHLKPKFFVTPGKSPSTAKYKKKKEYFPNMRSSPKDNLKENILKSPHAKGLYRLNYNTIVSPVGMYIRGTDMQLIKNVRAKTDDFLLTPTKKMKSPLSRNSKQSKPINGSTAYRKKIPLKLNLSPKVGINQIHNQEAIVGTENNSTLKNHVILPKVSYKLPLNVKTIKETKSPKVGNRVKKLLESTQSKVVIRHEGRIKSQRKQQGKDITPTEEALEICYEPEDISIHVEQAASKTNFIHKHKRI